jgi:anhydro-N-acetylmuramic acid kinase
MYDAGELYVGLMSGTSLDGIDAVLLELSIDQSPQPRLLAAQTFPLDSSLHEQLQALLQSGTDEIERMGRADRQLGLAFGAAVTSLLQTARVPASAVRAIGSHGQTIRHRPPGAHAEYPFTLQIGDPSSIAQLTGITTVADFRRRDIAAGGQGAPLVPPFHRAVFKGPRARAIVNIGGIANVTLLPVDGSVTGFDTGPGNTLMDNWIARHRGATYDRDGAWASGGSVVPELLQRLLATPYFSAAAPKSTGREFFNLTWLEQQIASIGQPPAPIDVQATLVELTARTIADEITALSPTLNEVFVCGGGAYNMLLMQRLEALLHPRQLGSTAQLGIEPEWVEAAAFAWLAQQTLAGRPGNDPAVTGASTPCVLGAIYPA